MARCRGRSPAPPLGSNAAVFYHDIPTTAGDWLRERHSGAQHGRIAVLKPDKWCSYMEYHLKLVSEGLLEGDRWHLISVQENLLFSYLENRVPM